VFHEFSRQDSLQTELTVLEYMLALIYVSRYANKQKLRRYLKRACSILRYGHDHRDIHKATTADASPWNHIHTDTGAFYAIYSIKKPRQDLGILKARPAVSP
jgi:hypothetical protein